MYDISSQARSQPTPPIKVSFHVFYLQHQSGWKGRRPSTEIVPITQASTRTPTKATACHIALPEGKTALRLSYSCNIKHVTGRVDYMNPRPDGGIVVGGGKWAYEEKRETWWDVEDDSTLAEMARAHFEVVVQRHPTVGRGVEPLQRACGRGVCLAFTIPSKKWRFLGWTWLTVGLVVIGTTAARWPYVGRVPGTENQYILAGFKGGCIAMIFLDAKRVVRMATDGVDFAETRVPGTFETVRDRLGETIPGHSRKLGGGRLKEE